MLVNEFQLDELLAIVDAGADGYLLKRELDGDLIKKALEVVLLGKTVLPRAFTEQVRAWAKGCAQGQHDSPGMAPFGDERTVVRTSVAAAQVLAELVPRGDLSKREEAIVRYLIRGASNKVIAHELRIAETTVKAHVKGLMRKIGATNRTQAAIWALSGTSPKQAV